jgi:hypothetical protein
MSRIIFYLFLFFFSTGQLHAQFMVDTIGTVEITGKREAKKTSFSTFTAKVSLHNAQFGFTNIEKDTLIRERVLANAIQIQNTKAARVRLDSMLVKSTPFDTTKVTVMLNIYAAGKRYSSAKVKLVKSKGKLSTLYFDTPVFLPAGTSYLGFTIITKAGFYFSFYTNTRLKGHLYAYNKERDEFTLLSLEDVPPITCPQIQLYYTRTE